MVVMMTNSAIKITLLQYSPKLHDHHYLNHFLSRLYMLLLLLTSSATSLTFDFPNFQPNDATGNTLFKTEGDAVINPQFMIQLTKDNVGSIGQVTYHEPFLLRKNTTGKLADFTTSFDFIIETKSSDNYAGRLVFFLAPNGSLCNSALGKDASSLRLPINNTPENNIKLSTQYPFVAVVFDIYRNHEPNTIELSDSADSFSAPPWNSGSIDVVGQQDYTTATISYDSISKNLSVSLSAITSEYSGANTLVISHLNYMVDLGQYLPDKVVVGFSAATNTNGFALHKIISWNFTSPSLVDDESLVPSSQKEMDESLLVSVRGPSFKAKSRKHMTPLVALISSAIGWFILAALLGLGVLNSCKHRATGQDEERPIVPDLIDVEFRKETGPWKFLRRYFAWAKGKSTPHDDQNRDYLIDYLFEKGIGPRQFSYRELALATNDFDEDKQIGRGGFGPVYRGVIKGSHVAVKKKSTGSDQGIEEYVREVRIVSQLRHRNLVKLIGFCSEKNQLLLVYEFIPKGSLDNHLFSLTSTLSWRIRYKIVQGLASALHYLHEECDECVLHRDIKTTNILLDQDFNVKIADFGIALLLDLGQPSVTTKTIAGTSGYIAPEYMTHGEVSKKSDVFSFGVVVLEIVCGRKQSDEIFLINRTTLVEWIWGLYVEGKVTEAADPKLRGGFDEKQMECFLIVGLWCAWPDHDMRPPIEQAILVLNFNAPLPNLQMPTFPSSSNRWGTSGASSLQSSISGR